MRSREARILDGVTKTLVTAWILWVSHTLVELKEDIVGLRKHECVSTEPQAPATPLEESEIEFASPVPIAKTIGGKK